VDTPPSAKAVDDAQLLGGNNTTTATTSSSLSMTDKAKAVDTPPSAKAVDDAQLLGGTAIKPVGWDRTGWEAFRYMLYNPDTGEVLTRTPLSWLKITVFYCIYYSCLAGFWIACLHIFFATLPDEAAGPKWTESGSLIGVNPGVGLRPRNNDKDIDSQMFVLRYGDTNDNPSEHEGEGVLNADYAARMKKFLKVYDNKKMHTIFDTKTQKDKKYPEFDPITQLGQHCGKFPYGFVAKLNNITNEITEYEQPCIFVKLNAIWGWVPKAYEVDANTPAKLKAHLQTGKGKAAGPNNVWIDCKGRYAADQEALEDGIEYFPESRGLPFKYFPYAGKTKFENGTVELNYHSPLVAIKITPKASSLGQLIHIECRAYYKGVKHVTKTKEGLVQFEVQIKKY